jgi:hypothetical protein
MGWATGEVWRTSLALGFFSKGVPAEAEAPGRKREAPSTEAAMRENRDLTGGVVV